MEKKEVNGALSDLPITMHKDFAVAVWTKHRLQDSKSNDKVVLEQLEKRFDSVLPLVKIDYLMLTAWRLATTRVDIHHQESCFS